MLLWIGFRGQWQCVHPAWPKILIAVSEPVLNGPHDMLLKTEDAVAHISQAAGSDRLKDSKSNLTRPEQAHVENTRAASRHHHRKVTRSSCPPPRTRDPSSGRVPSPATTIGGGATAASEDGSAVRLAPPPPGSHLLAACAAAVLYSRGAGAVRDDAAPPAAATVVELGAEPAPCALGSRGCEGAGDECGTHECESTGRCSHACAAETMGGVRLHTRECIHVLNTLSHVSGVQHAVRGGWMKASDAEARPVTAAKHPRALWQWHTTRWHALTTLNSPQALTILTHTHTHTTSNNTSQRVNHTPARGPEWSSCQTDPPGSRGSWQSGGPWLQPQHTVNKYDTSWCIHVVDTWLGLDYTFQMVDTVQA